MNSKNSSVVLGHCTIIIVRRFCMVMYNELKVIDSTSDRNGNGRLLPAYRVCRSLPGKRPWALYHKINSLFNVLGAYDVLSAVHADSSTACVLAGGSCSGLLVLV